MSTVIRPFRAADFHPLLALMRQTLELPQLDANLFARDFLLAPGFQAVHLQIAEADSQLAGYCLAPRQDPTGGEGTGWIAGFGVAPAYRRHGTATALLRVTIDAMRNEGIADVEIADVPVRYLLPGVDGAAFPAALALLTGPFGFIVRDVVASMGSELAARDFSPPASAIRSCAPGEYLVLRDALNAEFDPGWWAFLERSVFARLSGDTGPSDVLCWWEGDRPLGMVHFRQNRFGPLAVIDAARGRGIGTALTLAALSRMRDAGLARAQFLIGREEVQPFYARLGFSVLRRFTRLKLKL